MSKKNYQINVIDAEQIKKQNNQNLNNTNDENIQNHSQSISSNLTIIKNQKNLKLVFSLAEWLHFFFHFVFLL